jgi:GTP-binding protein EngB required for normal cell division
MVSADRRAYAYGIFSAEYGVSWFLGSTLLGVLYDRSLVALVVFSVIIQLAAIPVLVATGRQGRGDRTRVTERGSAMVHDGLLNSLRVLAHLEVLPPAERRLAAETAVKLAEALVYVAVIGEFKRGKSTLINALLGEDVLPTGITPVTAAPTLVRFGPAARAVIYRRDGSAAPVPLAQLPVVEHIAPLLASGLVLADTPGTGSVHRHNTETTTEFFPRIDVAVLVLTVDAPLAEAETGLLAAVGGTAARMAVCLNKTDLLSRAEVEEALDFIRPQIAAVAQRADVAVFPVSARVARAGDTEGSGLAALCQWLREVVVGAREALVRERACHVAAALLTVADVTLGLAVNYGCGTSTPVCATAP